jgi:hypothetical protein
LISRLEHNARPIGNGTGGRLDVVPPPDVAHVVVAVSTE